MIYVLSLNGEIIVIEHIPARVNSEIGERLFAPGTVEKTQAILRLRQIPKKIIQTPVFGFTATPARTGITQLPDVRTTGG